VVFPQVSLKTIEACAPHLAKGLEPFIKLDERLKAEVVEASLPVSAHRHQAGIAQHAEMLGDSRLAQGQPLDEDLHGLFAPPQLLEDLAASGFGDHLDRGGR